MQPNSEGNSLDPALARYSRQMLFDRIGEGGQQKLRRARVVLIGCGALGTVLANTLVRAGVGHLRICDRDFVERDNLQRQVLFDEDDIAENRPKSLAAATRLARINRDVLVEPVVRDVNHTNIEKLTEGFELVLDGTDNFETRFLINDLCVKTDRPWIYGAVIGATGLCMTIIPHDTPCLRCVFEEAPPPEMNPTCDTAGVIGPAVNIVASLQSVEAMKLLTGRRDEINRHLVHIDVWTGRFLNMNVQGALVSGRCPCCQRHEFSYLAGELASLSETLCGRQAVQIQPGTARRVDFATLAAKLAPVASAPVTFNDYLLRASIEEWELTLFFDGRAIIKGTSNPEQARSLYARYLGA